LLRAYSLTGILGVALIVVGAFLTPSGSPDNRASGQHVINWYKANHLAVQRSDWIIAIGVVMLALFVGVLVRRVGRESLWLSISGVIGFTVAAAGFATTGGVDVLLAHDAGFMTPASAQSWNVFTNDFFLPVLAGLCIFFVGIGLAFIASVALPRWVGYVAVVLGIGIAIPPISFFPLLAMPVWMIMVSIWMAVEKDSSPQARIVRPASAA
jgi:hypothetical protein